MPIACMSAPNSNTLPCLVTLHSIRRARSRRPPVVFPFFSFHLSFHLSFQNATSCSFAFIGVLCILVTSSRHNLRGDKGPCAIPVKNATVPDRAILSYCQIAPTRRISTWNTIIATKSAIASITASDHGRVAHGARRMDSSGDGSILSRRLGQLLVRNVSLVQHPDDGVFVQSDDDVENSRLDCFLSCQRQHDIVF